MLIIYFSFCGWGDILFQLKFPTSFNGKMTVIILICNFFIFKAVLIIRYLFSFVWLYEIWWTMTLIWTSCLVTDWKLVILLVFFKLSCRCNTYCNNWKKIYGVVLDFFVKFPTLPQRISVGSTVNQASCFFSIWTSSAVQSLSIFCLLYTSPSPRD